MTEGFDYDYEEANCDTHKPQQYSARDFYIGSDSQTSVSFGTWETHLDNVLTLKGERFAKHQLDTSVVIADTPLGIDMPVELGWKHPVLNQSGTERVWLQNGEVAHRHVQFRAAVQTGLGMALSEMTRKLSHANQERVLRQLPVVEFMSGEGIQFRYSSDRIIRLTKNGVEYVDNGVMNKEYTSRRSRLKVHRQKYPLRAEGFLLSVVAEMEFSSIDFDAVDLELYQLEMENKLTDPREARKLALCSVRLATPEEISDTMKK